MKTEKIIIGTRSSELALWQANYVKEGIEQHFPDIAVELKKIKTKGDKILDVALSKIGGKGLFTKELENAILAGEIDLAAHSLKDMPTELPEGLELAAITKRHSPGDALIARKKGLTLKDLPENGSLATGALRRQAQVAALRPDLTIHDLRGNINTRIKKFLESDWDAIILARAGVERIGLERYVSSYISYEDMLPAVGQGALGIEIAAGRDSVKEILSKLNCLETELSTRAERAFLRALGGGCQTPIAANAFIEGDLLAIEGLVASIGGDLLFREKIERPAAEPEGAGEELAEILLARGAGNILKNL